MAEVSLALPYPEPLRVTGPLPSLVLRTEDMWRRHNQCHRSEPPQVNQSLPENKEKSYKNCLKFQARRRELMFFKLPTQSPGRIPSYVHQEGSHHMSRGRGWRIHGSVEDTKLSTNKQHSL